MKKSKKFDDDMSVITTVTGIDECAISVDKSPEEDEALSRTQEAEMPSSPVEALGGLEVASTSETTGFDRMSVDSGSRRSGRKKTVSVLSGKDWWWRQDTGGGGASSEPGSSSVKDYVMEWIRSEIKKERPKSDWITAAPTTPPEGSKLRPPEKKKHLKRLEWWASLDEDRIKKKEKSRPAREWWREEFCEELTNKHKRKMIAKSYSNVEAGERQWWHKDEECGSLSRKRKKKKSWSRSSMDAWTDGHSGEVRTTGRRSSRDLASADIPRSGTISSTPSMRGTVCYVAPEYGGGGPLSEKCDIYSFGVLILVLISGRRPLQVMASPMSEFERANLISWARHLAHLGRLFDLVDPLLRAVDRDQVLLCITVALLCIQRSPARRPSSKEVVAMLSGQSEPPNLPLEFSPSPPGGFTFKSRKQ
ncbi:hypothetical protein J5N97_030034 [Dioscorea zingiberensis]|uniref:Protein kinase domain-containing protein n=1 Tax=Dioscorea zingiberensis TaxID=325984 RepID=A0A9D5H3W3_9LILI|nr:hypothetical protein J5N97_030034 [Dioscorea zingiberensis]